MVRNRGAEGDIWDNEGWGNGNRENYILRSFIICVPNQRFISCGRMRLVVHVALWGEEKCLRSFGVEA